MFDLLCFSVAFLAILFLKHNFRPPLAVSNYRKSTFIQAMPREDTQEQDREALNNSKKNKSFKLSKKNFGHTRYAYNFILALIEDMI